MSDREQFLLLPPVRIESDWEDIIGPDIPGAVRRQRWREWCKLARAARYRHHWNSREGCCEPEVGLCRHLDNNWCTLMDLPAGVNPYLTFKHGVEGMACMGAGFEPRQTGGLPPIERRTDH